MANAAVVVAFAIVAFAMVACSDATGPGSSVTVSVTVSQLHGPTLGMIDDTMPKVSCGAEMFAIARGTGQVTWLNADVRWYGGVDGSVLFDSASFTTENIQSAWGQPTIKGGQSQAMTWNLYATVPFKAIVRYHYRQQNGHQDTTSVAIDCGPQVPAGTPAPSVTNVAVQSGSDVVQPGDTLSVTYTASSPVGIWESVVQLSGPCDIRRIIPDSLHTSVTRTVRIALPRECGLGQSIIAAVGTWDAAMQESARTLDTHIALLDVTPPTIRPEYNSRGEGGWSFTLSGDYFAGDSIEIIPNASDNHALRSFVWEFAPAGAKDSVIATNGGVPDAMYIVVPRNVTGPVQMRFYAHDAVGLTSDTVIAGQDGGLKMYPTLAQPVKSATVSGEIRDLAIDAPRGLVYLMQSNERRLAVLSLDGMTVTPVPLPAVPTDLALTPSGDTLVVLLRPMRALGIIDVRQSPLQPSIVPLMTVDTSSTRYPVAMRVAANGKAFVAIPDTVPNTCALLEVDLASGAQRVRTDAGDGAMIGTGAMLTMLAIQKVVGDRADQARRAAAFSWLAMGASISGFTGPVFSGLLIDAFGHRVTFGVLVGVVLLALALVWINRALLPAHAGSMHAAQPLHPLELLRHVELRHILIATALVSMSWDLQTFVIPVHGTRVGLSAAEIGFVLGSFALATFAVRLAMPWLSQRITEWQVLTYTLFSATLAFALFPLFAALGPLMATAFLLGLGLGAAQPNVMSLVHAHAPQGRVGEALGLRSMIIHSSQVALPLVFGAFGSVLGAAAMFWTMAVLVCAGGIGAVRQGKHRRALHRPPV